ARARLMGITAVARALRVSVHRKNIAMCMAHNCKAHDRPEPSMNFATHVVTCISVLCLSSYNWGTLGYISLSALLRLSHSSMLPMHRARPRILPISSRNALIFLQFLCVHAIHLSPLL